MLGKSEPKKMCSLHGDVHPMVDWIRKNYIPLTNKSKHKVEVFRWQATQIPKPEWWQFWGISLTLKQNVSCPVLIHSRDYWSISFRWIWVENLKTCKKGKILEIYTLFVVEWKNHSWQRCLPAWAGSMRPRPNSLRKPVYFGYGLRPGCKCPAGLSHL